MLDVKIITQAVGDIGANDYTTNAAEGVKIS